MKTHAPFADVAAQIDAAFEERSTLSPASAPPDIVEAVQSGSMPPVQPPHWSRPALN